MIATRLMDEINNEKGYAVNFKLATEELAAVRSLIKMHWLYRIQIAAEEHVAKFDKLGMEHYHQLAHLLDHQTAWHTATRVLTRDAVTRIKELNFFKQLQSFFGNIEIADEAKFGWDNMLWRLVRPGNTDCASIHADRWFWDLARDWHVPDYPHERLNVWIAIHTAVGKNGLLVVPESQKRTDWRWHTEERYGQQKPVIDEDLDKLNLKLLPMAPGDGVVFHHNLLHGGAPNLADTTRVSLEFTILVPTHGRAV
jgi:hypothetical protein